MTNNVAKAIIAAIFEEVVDSFEIDNEELEVVSEGVLNLDLVKEELGFESLEEVTMIDNCLGEQQNDEDVAADLLTITEDDDIIELKVYLGNNSINGNKDYYIYILKIN